MCKAANAWLARCAALVAFAAVQACPEFAAASTEPRPNILFIMADDLAAHAISAYGSRFKEVAPTPNLDRLAREGMRFENCFAVNSICTPSRATIITGEYAHKNGVPGFQAIDPRKRNVAHALQEAGYHTCVLGKWHLGADPPGFDDWEILPGQGRYFDPVFYTRDRQTTYPGHVSDVIADLAIGRLARRPREKPFFLMVHDKAPHRNWAPHERNVAFFRDKSMPEPSNLFDDYATRSDGPRDNKIMVRDLVSSDVKSDPPEGLTGDALTRWKYQRYLQDYLACVRGVDQNVGRILEYLDANGLGSNTIVFLTSDQGFFLGEHGLFDKRFAYEESIRMPLLVRWPGVVQPGAICGHIVINCDFAPTFLDVAGGSAAPEMQGRSLRPILQDAAPADWRSNFYYRYYDEAYGVPQHYAVRTNTHKLIYYWKLDQWELFDLRHDPGEMHNIYGDPAMASTVAALKVELTRLRRDLDDRDQYADPASRPKIGSDRRVLNDGTVVTPPAKKSGARQKKEKP